MNIIKAVKLAYEYKRYGEDGQVEETLRAVDGVDLDVKKGDFVAILGHNGSGKSTLAKQINALLVPTEGTLYVDGMDTKDPEKVWDIRQSAGMVFQNPDNQIIGSVVDEDVGFGPENMGIPTKEIWERVEESLRSVGMWEYRHSSPNKLSGGQKQRVAIAGVVAMHPKCIVLDEPTAMLDPVGRRDVIRTVRALNHGGRCDGHPYHPLYGRGHLCGQSDRYGRWKSCHAGNTGRDFFSGGYVEKIPAGCSAGDTSGPRTEESRTGFACRHFEH